MKIETLNERIEKAKQKIERKTATIAKKEALIEKKKDAIRKLGFDPENIEDRHANRDLYYLTCDIGYLREDIKRGSREIEETVVTLEKYEKQLAGELKKESMLLTEIPETMKRLQDELVAQWDAWDLEKQQRMDEDRKTMDGDAYRKKYSFSERTEFFYKTETEIHAANMEDAKAQIINLYQRVRSITGEVTDWMGITLDIGTHGWPILSGFVVGKEGRAKVESIYAGGYNIQRLHIRVLVHEF